ncbi:MAG: DUF3422 family protein [Lautropia sp.]
MPDLPTPVPTSPSLPPDDDLRQVLHDEVHARPSARIRLPALVTYVAVLNEDVSREEERAHLQTLDGQHELSLEDLKDNFLTLRLDGCAMKWERHSEFTRYTVVQSLSPEPSPGGDGQAPGLPPCPVAGWLGAIPGRTIAAIEMPMLHGDPREPQGALRHGRTWFGDRAVIASMMGGYACAITDLRLGPGGFERILVVAPPDTSVTRAGRISQRLLEIETYRLMALRGLPRAKALGPMLHAAEAGLADITARLEGTASSDQELLDRLTALAATVERATAENGYRFSATQAYDALVRQRIAELRESPVPGAQTIGDFMQRRLSPAMATVASTSNRLAALSTRVERAGALLRTRVDIATEAQNQQLLGKLTRGQELQLRLQSTVEGLSIAAISYYVVSLLLYVGKAAKAAGAPIDPELAAGLAIPLVLWAVWRTTRRIHDRLHRVGARKT